MVSVDVKHHVYLLCAAVSDSLPTHRGQDKSTYHLFSTAAGQPPPKLSAYSALDKVTLAQFRDDSEPWTGGRG